jgi:heat shock protein HslJ
MRILFIATALLLAACGTVGGVYTSPLAGTTWRLAALQSSDDAIGTMRPADPSLYEITFNADGTASLRLDCNRGTGTWTSPGDNQLTFTPLAVTRAFCGEGSLDTRVARELGYVRSYVRDGDTLTLNMMADGGNLVWTRQR